MNRKFNPGTVISLLLVSATLVLAWAGWNEYRRQAGRSLVSEDAQTDVLSAGVIQELNTLFAHMPPPVSRFDDVTQKNLFSPDRKAWESPVVSADAPSPEQKPPPPPGPIGVRLYGTTIVLDQKNALLYFERFNSQHKYRVMKEGDTARDDGERADGLVYTLKRLERDKVILEDQHGREHTVGLYDHTLSRPPRPQAMQARPQVPSQPQSRNQSPSAPQP